MGEYMWAQTTTAPTPDKLIYAWSGSGAKLCVNTEKTFSYTQEPVDAMYEIPPVNAKCHGAC